MTLDTRLQAFEACFNFRDLGGYETVDGRRVRWGRLFRSDSLHRLTDDDLTAFRGLGLRTVIDLRSAMEIDLHGRLRADGADVAWHHLPMIDDVDLRPRPAGAPEPPAANDPEPGEGYLAMLGTGSAVAAVFELLAAPGGLPAVFHCTSGKDRTGIIAALLLDVMGVPDDVIAADYALTQQTFARSDDWFDVNEPEFATFLGQFPAGRRDPRPEKILGFLEKVRAANGTVGDFLASAGVDDAVVERLREKLLER